MADRNDEPSSGQSKELLKMGEAAVYPGHEEDEDEASSSSDDDDLGLEGVLVRHPGASSSSSSDSEEEDDDGDEEAEDEEDQKEFKASSKQSSSDLKRPVGEVANTERKTKKHTNKKRRKSSSSPDMIQVDFTFHDMDEKFFHGLKSLLHNSSTIYQPFSSALADLMIDNISVGTVLSTEGDAEHNVYGFASVLPVKTYRESPAVAHLREICTRNCPPQHRKELDVVLSGTTRRPTGIFLHGRMINLPLDITLVLHQQLVLDMDWAVQNAEGGEEERKSLDFGAFVRIAPCQASGGALLYRYFDDEVFAGRSEFSYTADAPKSYSKEEPLKLQIMILSKTGHRQAMQDLERIVDGGGR